MSATPVEQRLTLADFRFADGAWMASLDIAYWTMGSLNPARDNLILLCHGSSGGRDWGLPYCAPGEVFDAAHWFVVSPDMPGGGLSSRARANPDFPASYAIADLTAANIALIEHFETRARLFCGASMAGLVGLDLAARRPDLVDGLALWAAGFRSDGYARAVADALARILALDEGEAGMRAAVAAFLPGVVGRDMVADMPAKDFRALVETTAGDWALRWRADELVARYDAVSRCDLAADHGGLAALAEAVRCPSLFLQAASDAIFPPQAALALTERMPRGRTEVVQSPMGHMATFAPAGSPEQDFFRQRTRAFLAAL